MRVGQIARASFTGIALLVCGCTSWSAQERETRRTRQERDGQSLTAGAGALTVFAGVPSGIGSADGTGPAARFNYPQGAAVDGSGNVYVADFDNHTIRKVTPAGVVSTFAGTAGMSGSVDGAGVAARFNAPAGVGFDGAGNAYVADSGNSTIRKISPSGVVSTFAGTPGVQGSADGTAAEAQFSWPGGLTVDGAGNLYVADTGNNTIRKITPSGTVSTLAGAAGQQGSADGTGSAAQFNAPQSVAVDGSGYVYVADSENSTIRKISPAGEVSTLAGSAGVQGSLDGTGSAAQFNWPTGLTVDGAANVYVSDSLNDTIRKITPSGAVSTVAGTAGNLGSADGVRSSAQFLLPRGITLDRSGNLFVVDSANSTLRRVDPSGVVSTVAGRGFGQGSNDGTGAAARFLQPEGIAVDSAGNIYVTDRGNSTIRKITPAGAVSTLAGTAGVQGSADGTGAAAQFNYPRGAAVDSSGNIYVADDGNNTIRKITPSGVVSTIAGAAGSQGSSDGTGTEARFKQPRAVAVDLEGDVYVADYGNSTVRKITPAGLVITLAGTAGVLGRADGLGAAARFFRPTGVAVDASGNVYVADTGNCTIRKITPSGEVSTFAGTAPVPGSADGTGATAQFQFPYGLAVDGSGNVYVADRQNNAIRKITPSGEVSTPVGSAGSQAGNFPGPLPASLALPTAVAIGPSGDLFITIPSAVLVASNSSPPGSAGSSGAKSGGCGHGPGGMMSLIGLLFAGVARRRR